MFNIFNVALNLFKGTYWAINWCHLNEIFQSESAEKGNQRFLFEQNLYFYFVYETLFWEFGIFGFEEWLCLHKKSQKLSTIQLGFGEDGEYERRLQMKWQIYFNQRADKYNTNLIKSNVHLFGTWLLFCNFFCWKVRLHFRWKKGELGDSSTPHD